MNCTLMPRAGRRRQADDNMIPLINIVFLLLIFFMIAGKVRQMAADIDLPLARLGPPPAHGAVRLQMTADRQLYIDNQPVTAAQLDAMLAASGGEGRPLHLLADRNLLARDLDPVLAQLRRHGLPNVALYTRTTVDAR